MVRAAAGAPVALPATWRKRGRPVSLRATQVRRTSSPAWPLWLETAAAPARCRARRGRTRRRRPSARPGAGGSLAGTRRRATRRGPELARRQVVGEQAPGLAPARPAHPVHDPTQARTALPHGPGAVPADLTAVARSLPPATSWLTYMPASCGISESPLPHDTRCGRRTQATDKVFQQLGAGSRGRGRLGSASGGLRKCREVRVSELAREHCGSQIGIAVVDHVI